MHKMFQKVKEVKIKLGRWFWVILVVVLLVAWRIVASATKSVKVEVAEVSRGTLVETVSTSGTVLADKYAELTFTGGGKVVSVGVKTGQEVNKGQFIAQVDAIALNAAYEEAMNDYRNYQAIADQVLDSVSGHSKDESLTQRATRTTAEVNRDNAYNAVLAAKENLRNASIYAPFAGVMDTVSPSSPGINVLAGAANYTIVDPLSVYFDAEVEETDLPNIKPGQKVNVKLDAYPDAVLQGLVETIGMVAFTSSTGGNAYHVRISLPPNTEQKFKVGMGGDVEIIYGTINDTLKVPAFSIVSDTTNYVWVVEKGRAKKVSVEVGQSSIDETEIKSGLSEGETVISQPPANLKDGQRVSI